MDYQSSQQTASPEGRYSNLPIRSSSNAGPESQWSATDDQLPFFESMQPCYSSPQAIQQSAHPTKTEPFELNTSTTKIENNGQDLSPATSSKPIKRGRGRPPKYPRLVRDSDTKPLKKRSKDGCITCRRRKKKCDETKPTCLICDRSNNVCEGYAPRSRVNSSASDSKSYSTPESLTGTAETDSSKAGTIVTRKCQAEQAVKGIFDNIHGVENETDRFLLEHYPKLSCILNLPDNQPKPFSDLLLDMALGNRGLMHSILYLSGSHLASTAGFLDLERHYHHLDCSLKELNLNQRLANHSCDAGDDTMDDYTVAHALVIFLSSVLAGQMHGEYRHHMEAAKHLLVCQRSHNEQFQSLSTKFIAYYDFSRSLTWPGRTNEIRTWTTFQIPSFVQREAGTFFGVLNTLFTLMSKITILRDHIRARRCENLLPYVEESMKSKARQIEMDIRNWDSRVAHSTDELSHYNVSQLYRQCNYVYLYRTIMDSAPALEISRAVDVGLGYLRAVGENQCMQGILLTPIFILGCAAFEPRQRHEIEVAIELLRKHRGGGNITPAKAVIENVWGTVDEGLEGKSWDWDHMMKRMGMDFIVV